METFPRGNSVHARSHGLNRTMQYGNPRGKKKKKQEKKSLNRTMQYGNQTQVNMEQYLISFKSYYVVWKRMDLSDGVFSCVEFKSYYVVWKRVLKGFLCFRLKEFKSYYVVWKQFYRRAFADNVFQFKSYYVVWKPRDRQFFRCGNRGLNRTMQYGNLRPEKPQAAE